MVGVPVMGVAGVPVVRAATMGSCARLLEGLRLERVLLDRLWVERLCCVR